MTTVGTRLHGKRPSGVPVIAAIVELVDEPRHEVSK